MRSVVCPCGIPKRNGVVHDGGEIREDVEPLARARVDTRVGKSTLEGGHHLLGLFEVPTVFAAIVPVPVLGLVELDVEIDATDGHVSLMNEIYELLDLLRVGLAMPKTSTAGEPVRVDVVFAFVASFIGIDGVLEEMRIDSSSAVGLVSAADEMDETLLVSQLEYFLANPEAGVDAFDDFPGHRVSGNKSCEEEENSGLESYQVHGEDVGKRE